MKDLLLLFYSFGKSQFMAEHLIYSDTRDVLVLAFYCCMRKLSDETNRNDHEDNYLTFLDKEDC